MAENDIGPFEAAVASELEALQRAHSSEQGDPDPMPDEIRREGDQTVGDSTAQEQEAPGDRLSTEDRQAAHAEAFRRFLDTQVNPQGRY